MANQIKYSIGFEVQQQSLNQLKSSLQQLQRMRLSDIMKINDSDISAARESFKQISTQAREVEKALDAAFNKKLNTFNIQAFNQSLSNSRLNLNQVYESFSQAGAKGQAAFRNLAMQITGTNTQLRESHQILDKVAETFANSAKWHIASSAINTVTRSIEQAWGYTKALDASLNDIRVVTGKSADEMANFAVQANEAAKSLGKSTTDYTNAALIYAQQGLSDAEIEERAKITLKAANVTGQSTDAVSEQLTAVWNGYKVTAEEAELYVDRLAAVAATSASNLEELSTGMSKVASAAAAMGVGEDKLAAQLATIISVTKQAPESVGTALRTVYARISDIQAGLDEQGVTLGRYSGKMASMGIDVLDVNGKLRDMGDVMEEIGAKWDTMSREQQVYLAQTMAGQRQYNNLLALFDNFEQYNKELAIAQGAAGTLQEQNDIYMESTAAHLKILKASVEGIYDSLTDTDTIEGLIDVLAKGATLIENLVDSLGGGVGLLKALGAIGVTVFSQQIGNGIQTTINNMEAERQKIESIKQALEEVEKLNAATQNDYTEGLINKSGDLLNITGRLPQEEVDLMRKSLLDLVNAANQEMTLDEEVEVLENRFLSLCQDIDMVALGYNNLDEMLANPEGLDYITATLRNLLLELNPAQEEIADLRSTFVELQASFSTPDFGTNFENFQILLNNTIQDFQMMRTSNGGNFFDILTESAQNSIRDIEQRLSTLRFDPSNIQQSSNEISKIYSDLALVIRGMVSDTTQAIDDAQEGHLERLKARLEEASAALRALQTNNDRIIESAQKKINTQDITKMVGGISQVAMGIQQVQNLGSIWKNADLSGGQKLLQTITNLSFSLPMLTTGLKTALGAFDLLKISAADSFRVIELGATRAGLEVQIFNSTLAFSPLGLWVIGITAATAAIGIFINGLNKASEAQQKAAKEAVEEAKKNQEQIESNKQLYSSIEQVNKKYQNGQITRLELKSTIQELINKYELESQSIKTLTEDYDKLADSIKEARKSAAQQGLDSAKEQRNNAAKQVRAAAKGDLFDNGLLSKGDYSLYLSGAAGLENSDIISAMKKAGAVESMQGGLQGGLLFETGSSTKDIVALYSKISQAVEEIEKNVDAAERKNSKYFQGMKEWLSEMKEPVEDYKNALKNIALYGTELEGFSSDKFENVSNLSDYMTQREEFVKSVEDMLVENGVSAKEAADTVDTYLSEYFGELYTKYDEASKFVQNLREKFGQSQETQEIEDFLTTIPPQLLSFVESINLDDISGWEDLKSIVDYLLHADLSNLLIVADPDAAIQAATSQYDLYSSLVDQIKGSKKQSISKTEFEKLNPQIQEFFSLMANGQYKMTGDAKEFYETVNNLSLQGFKQNIKDLQGSSKRLENLKGVNYQSLKQAAYNPRTKETNQDLAQSQLDYLIESGYDLNKIIQWKAELEGDGQAQASALHDMAVAVDEVGNNVKNFSTYLKANEDAIYQNELAIARSADSLKTLQNYLKEGQIGEKAFTQAAIELDKELDTQNLDSEELDNFAQHLQEIAVQSNELSDELKDNEDAAEIVAKGIMKMNDAVETLSDNWEEWGSILNNSSDMSEEYSEAMNSTREAVADLLDTSKDFVSEDFIRSHLSEISEAAKGSETAIDSLKASLAQDLVARIMLENGIDEAAQTDILSSIADLQAMIPDIEVGATINDGDFLAKANQLIQDCGMTVDQANAMFDALGFEPVFETNQQPVTQRVPRTVTETTMNWQTGQSIGGIGQIIDYKIAQPTQYTYTDGFETVTGMMQVPAMANKRTPVIKSLTRKAGGSFNSSSSRNPGGKSSGKKGGGGGKKGGSKKGSQPDTSKKDLKKEKEDQRDIYHDINIELDQLNRELERVQKEQERLYGKDLIDNLTKQVGLLEQHKELLEEKHELQQQDLKSQRETLENLGVTFDEYGNISNYLSILAQKQAEINARTKDYNNLIEAYNESTNKDMKKNIADEAAAIDKHIKQMEDEYKDLQKKIKDYDGLREDMEDLVDQIEEETQKQIELNIKKFRMELEIRLDMGQAERDWNEFRREVLEHTDVLKDTDFDKIFGDALKDAKDMTSYFNVGGSIGSLEMLTNQLMNTRAQIEAINETGKSAIYGDNKAQAMEDLQNDLDELMSQMKDVEDLIDSIDEAYLDTIDDIDKQFDKQIDDYEYVNELIEHNIDLLGLLYGDKNYEAMQKYYATLERNNLKQLDSLKQQRNFWKEQWESAVARGDTQAAKQFEKNYKDTISNLNKLIEDAAKTIQDKYSNAIDKIFDALDKKISNGLGTDYLNDEWQLMNKNADEYLDTINSAFAIQQTERKYQQALNDAKNIKNQQALKTLMDEQLDILRNKEKITQYDIDRAEKLLQVEQARAALEDAQAAKTSMRLRRDTQGNYSYEYVADSGAIEDAKGNLASAQNDLYNFDKDRYQSNLDDMLSAWKEFQSEYKDIITDTALSEQQRVEKMALLRDQYGEYINDKTAENMNIRNNLMESAFADLAALYDTDVANYNQMSIDEQNILMGELVPAWQSGIQQMANTVAGEGGFIPTCEEAFESLEEQTLAYQESLEELADAAGINLQDIQDGVYDLADEFENLIEKNDDLLDRMTSQMFAIEALRAEAQSLVADYNNVYTAAAQAVTQLHDFVQAEKAAAAAYAQTAAAYESMVNRIQRANAAYAANPYGSYSYNGGNNSGSDSSGGGSSGSSGGTGSGSGSANKSANKTPNPTGYKSDSIVNGIMGGSYYKKYYYDTGGYTGNWNSSEGKLAVLHQKEQVFNEEDTSRLLNAVKILKNISESMNIDVFAKTSSLSHKNIFSNDSSDTLEQDVHIEATFPNVDSKREIEEALTGLVNAAAQRAMRR